MINEIKSCFLEKINKIDKLSQAHQEEKREGQINKIRNDRGETITNTTEIQKNRKRMLFTVISQQFKQLRRNGQISRNIQPAKTESERQFELTNH